MVYTLELSRDVNTLRTMRLALTAAYAVVSLAHRLHSTVVTYQETPLEPLEMLLLATLCNIT